MEHHHKRMTSSSPITNNHMVQGSHAHCGTVGLHSDITHPVVQGSHAPCGTGDLHTLRDHSEITHPVEQGSHTPCGTDDLLTLWYRDHMQRPPVVQGVYTQTSTPLWYRGSTLRHHPAVQGLHAPCCTGGQHYRHISPCCTGITCPLLYRGSTLQTYITLLYRDHMHPC